MKDNPLNLESIFSYRGAEALIEKAQPYLELMMQYDCAIKEVTTKFEVLNQEFSVRYNRNPVESIRSRLKTPRSIAEKLRRENLPLELDSIRSHITDVAGVRIICSFPEDIYTISGMFLGQDDIKLIRMKDYIKNPKPNGYRSLHLIVEVPIFLTDRTIPVPVEVQFRTIAMDFWASIEHKLKYKKEVPDSEALTAELKECADQIGALDLRMQEIHRRIDKSAN